MRTRAGTKAQRKRAEAAAAKKQRRQMVIAFGGLGVLAILLVIQGPKLLDAFGGSDAPVAAPVTTVVAAPPDVDRGSQEALDALDGGGDPFAAHALADNDPQVGVVASPDGSRDPFAPARSASPPPSAASPSPAPAPTPPTLPNQIVVGTPTEGAVAKPGWIVVLASIQTRLGQSYAERFATRVRSNGLDVEVLDSSTRKPLRAGYYVVYTGPYATLGAVQRAAAHVHAFGYRTAYIRQILRY